MSLPQNLSDDLATLDTDAGATATATTAKASSALALTAAQQNDAQAAADLGKAQGAQAAQLAKVKADLDAVYG